MEPLRGEVWEVRLPAVGMHPAIILTIDSMIPHLSSVTIAVITGTAGPASTHIPLESESGLTRYDVSYANATDLHSVDCGRLRRRRGRVHLAELQRLESAIRTYLGL